MGDAHCPVIGITGYFVYSSEIDPERRLRGVPGQDWALFTMDYIRSVEKGGGIPFLIPVQAARPERVLERVDGLLLAGGSDIDPRLYGEKPLAKLGKVNPERDEFELALVRAAFDAGKPVLGICRGMQLINVALGGTLYQDLSLIPGSYEHVCLQYPKWHPVHEVSLEPDSHLAHIYGGNRLEVNSFHHQAVNKLGTGLVQTASSQDGIIEGIELPGASFAVGVQWHPEMMTERHLEQTAVFSALVDASRQD